MYIDFRGNTINEGDTVIYPVRKGSGMWLNSGVVKELHPNGLKVVNEADRIVTLTCLDRVVVIK